MIGKNRKKISQLKQNCYNARNNLIVSSDNQANELVGCIKLVYFMRSVIIDAWKINIQPEDTYKVIGPYVKYCSDFDPKKLLRNPCTRVTCPMYRKYQQYLEEYEALQRAKGKIK